MNAKTTNQPTQHNTTQALPHPLMWLFIESLGLMLMVLVVGRW